MLSGWTRFAVERLVECHVGTERLIRVSEESRVLTLLVVNRQAIGVVVALSLGMKELSGSNIVVAG